MMIMSARRFRGWLSREFFNRWLVHGPRNGEWRRYRAGVAEARAGIEIWNGGDREERSKWVLKELQAIVRLAGEKVPYYREVFRKVGFDPRADFSFADYAQLPPLDRQSIRSRTADLLVEDFPRSAMKEKRTGGTTGEPLRIWVDYSSQAWSDETRDWAFARVGYRLGDRLGLVWGANADPQMQTSIRARVVNWLLNVQAIDCFRLSNEVLDQIHSRLSRYQPDFLRCYPASLALLAGRLFERGVRPTYPTKGILTGAEKLQNNQRTIISSVFEVPAYESYGSRECGLLAMQMVANDNHLHVISPNIIIEPFGSPDPVSGSEVLVTILHRRGMPLLRYRIGDRAQFQRHNFEAPAEILQAVTGRVLDLIYLPNGRLIHSCEFPALFKNFDIREYRVVQQADGNVTVMLVPGARLKSDDVEYIERVLRRNLYGISSSISLVSAIERSATGKLQPVVSHYRPADASA